MSQRVRSIFTSRRSTYNGPEGRPALIGYRVASTNNVPDDSLIFGHFQDLLIGQWGGIELLVDRFTHSRSGTVRVVVFVTVDVGVRHSESFCVSTGA